MAMCFKVFLSWIVLQTIDSASSEGIVPGGIVFIADSVTSGSIRTGPMETLEKLETIPLENLGIPVAVDYDHVERQVYWTDSLNKTINRANVDGTEQEVVLQLAREDDPAPDGLAIDTMNRHIYWTDANTKKIERANLDGSDRRIILDEDLVKPRAIVVDPAGQQMYWTDWEASRIERANLDGTERTIMVDTNIKYPNGIFVSFENKRIYWCDAEKNRIESVDLDGDDRKLHFAITNADIHPFDIIVYDNTFYWTDWFLSRIINLPFDSNTAEFVGPESFNRPAGMHLYQENDRSCTTNICENGSRCRQLTTGYQCACAPGYSGTFCEINIDECVSSPCQNSGTCVDASNGYNCACAEGWTGAICDEDVNECNEGLCGDNADCTNFDGSFVCKCHTGYYESSPGRCEIIDNCDPLPCQNAGVCINKINDFECTCLYGFQGDICQFAPPDPCLVYQPCRNGATCQSTGNLFTCQCPHGYTGQNCERVVDWCLSIETPCYNDGICSSDATEFMCACVNGFTGKRCETAPITTQSPGCPHPGIFENGRIIPDMPPNELYPSGKKIEFLCQAGYSLDGQGSAICQLPDYTWSHEKPACVESEPTLSISVLVVVAVVVLAIILFLVITLLYCVRKRRSSTNELLNRPRSEPQLRKKEDRMYNTSPSAHARESGYQEPQIPMNSLYQSRIHYVDDTEGLTINRTKSIHIYEDISERRGRSSIPNRMPPPTPTHAQTEFDLPPAPPPYSYDVPKRQADVNKSDYAVNLGVTRQQDDIGMDNEGYTELRKDRSEHDEDNNHVYMQPRN